MKPGPRILVVDDAPGIVDAVRCLPRDVERPLVLQPLQVSPT
ncbi:hypothetical protein SAMN05443572_1011208 [Myxococcus fulvus]|uniref:Response regulator n=1 Tax=Myxococcus fulvus TaxID=33 RepID=A0ABY1BYF7_MYXFU|nr:hypothetical protein [Myxococcus fulvus]SET13669.1 hypothetical protein SAMN05443572_1011208 [Myxococcus fulvus]